MNTKLTKVFSLLVGFLSAFALSSLFYHSVFFLSYTTGNFPLLFYVLSGIAYLCAWYVDIRRANTGRMDLTQILFFAMLLSHSLSAAEVNGIVPDWLLSLDVFVALILVYCKRFVYNN